MAVENEPVSIGDSVTLWPIRGGSARKNLGDAVGSSGILDEFPNLAAYVARGEARPAYQRAFVAQLAINASRG